jgi:hypothetical protein
MGRTSLSVGIVPTSIRTQCFAIELNVSALDVYHQLPGVET